MALGEIAQNYVYSKIDTNIRAFGINISKPSDICKKYSAMTEEQILAEIATNKETAKAKLEAEIATKQAQLEALG